MTTAVFTYPALRVQQAPGAPHLVLLSASAVEINRWVGIPQKSRMLDGETIGFQRDDDPGRVAQIAQFYQDPRNVIHNPILCAIRTVPGGSVEFRPRDGADLDAARVPGELVISAPELLNSPLRDLFRLAREALELRVPELEGLLDPEPLIAKLREKIDLPAAATQDDDDASDEDSDDPDAAAIPEPQEALTQDSHVTEFWAELRAREILLTKLGDSFTDDEFLGFGRDAVESYLRPVVLVDGQHRLLGALESARQALKKDPGLLAEAADALESGRPTTELERTLLMRHARSLPISLLLDPSPGEHVFQFVVVNQKASPVRPALLATIISTSLSDQELEPVKDRLENAGIPLRNSQAITYLVKNEKSPFANLVARGMADEGQDLLPWTVLGQLAAIFRDLKGARFFHDRKIDYADIWKRRLLESSKIVETEAGRTAYDIWRQPDGPWREAFMAFWTAVRDKLGNTVNPEKDNFWGRPRTSNLFNKPSLLTLQTDYFAYLTEARRKLDTIEDVTASVDEWLLYVDGGYFDRDWKLAGVKKDSTGIRKQWSKTWFAYRRDPRALPRLDVYRSVYRES